MHRLKHQKSFLYILKIPEHLFQLILQAGPAKELGGHFRGEISRAEGCGSAAPSGAGAGDKGADKTVSGARRGLDGEGAAEGPGDREEVLRPADDVRPALDAADAGQHRPGGSAAGRHDCRAGLQDRRP